MQAEAANRAEMSRKANTVPGGEGGRFRYAPSAPPPPKSPAQPSTGSLLLRHSGSLLRRP